MDVNDIVRTYLYLNMRTYNHDILICVRNFT